MNAKMVKEKEGEDLVGVTVGGAEGRFVHSKNERMRSTATRHFHLRGKDGEWVL